MLADERCAVPGCDRKDELELDHVWRGSLLVAIGWSAGAINDPINLQLLCPMHHADKTAHEARLLAADDALSDDVQYPTTFAHAMTVAEGAEDRPNGPDA